MKAKETKHWETFRGLVKENEELKEVLRCIAEFKGKTLLGYGRYDEGANAAFEQLAEMAALSLKRISAGSGE